MKTSRRRRRLKNRELIDKRPVRPDEEKAITEIATWIDQVEHKLKQEATAESLLAMLCDYLRRGLIERMTVIENAENDGDHIAHQALMREFHEMLDVGEMPPASLRAYAARVALKPVTKGPGAHTWHDNWLRDLRIASLVEMACRAFELRPYRNREQRRRQVPSGCSLVAAALARRGFRDLSEARVEGIWRKLGRTTESIASRWRAEQISSASIR
jgi:hypothetical protein